MGKKPETETLAFLESHVIFHGVTEQDLAIIFPFLSFEHFSAGTAIIEESTAGNSVYVVTEGSVEVTRMLPEVPGGDVQSLKLAEFGKGDSFGEMELLDTMKRSATVTALEDTECLVLSTGSFIRIFEFRPDAYPIILMNIARELSRRLRTADNRIAELEALVRGHARAEAEG